VKLLAVLACALVVGCGQDHQDRVVPPSVPPRVRMLTDEQFANAVVDLLGVESPAIHTPGTSPHQLVHEEVMAIDGGRLTEYRMAAEQVAMQVAAAPSCTELACTLDFAARAFRRPLDDDERDRLTTLFAQGGFPLVVEAVLQAPSFLYRTELGTGEPSGTVELTPHELAAELGFLFYDSLPDAELRAAADDGSLRDPAVLAHEVDRLLDEARVQDHLLDVVLEWLQAYRVLDAYKDPMIFPELTPELRESMFGETKRFVGDVLFHRGGSLRALLTSRDTFVDERLAAHYGIRGVHGDAFVPVHLGAQRAGILTQASLLTALASANRESIILRGKYVNDTFLCTPELGRPPFDAISQVASFTSELSESQFAYYRQANAYCAGCHRTVDPPGRALERFDGIGRARNVDELGIAIEDDTTIVLDGAPRSLHGGVALGTALAASPQVARCAIERFAQHAFGRALDAAGIDRLVTNLDDGDIDLVDVFRAIAVSRAFRDREAP
jgi:hypothetical protein